MNTNMKKDYQAPAITEISIVARELLSTGGEPGQTSLGIEELGGDTVVEEQL